MTTTQQDWRTLAAGRELDALVAFHVMGWCPTNTSFTPHDDTTRVLGIMPPDGMGFGALRGRVVLDISPVTEVPPFSTDIAAAWQVLDRMMQTHFMFGVNGSHESGYWCTLYPSSGAPVETDSCGSPAEAICRAALAATEQVPA